MPTVREHFNIRIACWRDKGGCSNFHSIHIHVDFLPTWQTNPDKPNYQPPKCMGGTAGATAPGSPDLVAFEAEVRKRFPELKPTPGKYNCRPVAGSSVISYHAYWQAIDLFPPDDDIVGYGDQVYAWINGPWEEDVAEPLTAAEIAELRKLIPVAGPLRGIGEASKKNVDPNHQPDSMWMGAHYDNMLRILQQEDDGGIVDHVHDPGPVSRE